MPEPQIESAETVPCPGCGGSGEVATGKVIAGNRHEPPEPVLDECPLCEGKGEVPPVMLDPEFRPERRGTC